MKNIQSFTLLFFLGLTSLMAQQKNTITVTGEAIKTIEIEKYIINIEFREVIGDNYRNIKGRTVDQLRKEFASELSKVNIDFSSFEEDIMYHITSHTYNTSAFYTYETNSLTEVQHIISQKMEGITNSRVDIIAKELTNEKISILSKNAIDDAREIAQAIASKIGKNIGNITQIENTNNKYRSFYSGRVKEPLKYYVKVTFLLE